MHDAGGEWVEGLRRSDPYGPGIRRVRRGRGYRFYGPDGEPVDDPEVVDRCKALVLPPAWRDVWICPWPDGHLQAVGVDEAGRRQYVYHADWQEHREKAKHDRMLDFAEVLPDVRERVRADLGRRGLVRERVLAAAVRLVDLGFFRAGGESYAQDNETYGIATLLRDHAHRSGGCVVFDYPAKGGVQRRLEIGEPEIVRVVTALRRQRAPGQGLIAYRVGGGWYDARSDDVNAYLREISGGDYTAKDFRTWHATVLAAVGVAVAVPGDSEAARKRLFAHVTREVAEYLGNTPAVARASYIDPRVFRLAERGTTVARALPQLGGQADFGELSTQGDVEKAVRTMLRRNPDA
jgi:DNA topoisomerase IB